MEQRQPGGWAGMACQSMPARRAATQAVCCATGAGAGWRRRDDGWQGAGEGGGGEAMSVYSQGWRRPD